MKITNNSVFQYEDYTKVNTVNNLGYMGKGLAKEFKLRNESTYSYYLERYRDAKGGDILFDRNNNVIHVFTKEDFRKPSKREWLLKVLLNLQKLFRNGEISKLAIPLIGAGNGGESPEWVKDMIKEYLNEFDVIICLGLVDTSKDKEKLLKVINQYKNSLKVYPSLDKFKNEILNGYSIGKIELLRDLRKLKNFGDAKYIELLKWDVSSLNYQINFDKDLY